MKLKAILSAAVAMTAMEASAQNYDVLWKQVDKFILSDLPKSALGALRQIRQKARTEKNEAQLLRTYLVERNQRYEISADSARTTLAEIRTITGRQKDPLTAALWNNALGHLLYHIDDENVLADTTRLRLAREAVLRSFADLDLLGRTKAVLFMPVFVKGEHDALFGDDLLHVLALDGNGMLEEKEREALFGRVTDYYEQAGNRPAALYLKVQNLAEQREAYEALTALAKENEDLAINLETYIALAEGRHLWFDEERSGRGDAEYYALLQKGIALYGKAPRAQRLKTLLEELTKPSVEVIFKDDTLLMNHPTTFSIKARNAQRAVLRIRRVEGANGTEHFSGEEDYKALLPRTKVVAGTEQTLTFAQRPPYEEQTVKGKLPPLPAGVYLVELEFAGKVHDRSLFSLSSLRALTLTQEKKVRVAVVDAQTGRLRPNARVYEYERTRGRYTLLKTHTAAADGFVYFSPAPRKYDTDRFYYASAEGEKVCTHFFVNLMSNPYEYRLDKQPRLHLSTDRNIYRPGQKVRASVLLYGQKEDTTRVEAGRTVAYRILGADHREIGKGEATTDEFGVAPVEFDIPATVLPGTFRLEATVPGTAEETYFRVEEYKRPTLVAEFQKPADAYAYGDSLTVSGTLKTYTEAPVAEAKVRYRIGPQDVQGETVTDAQGRFSVPLRAPLPDDDEEWMSWLSVHADITAPNGETTTAHLSVPVSKYTSMISVNWGENLCKENLPEVTVRQLTALRQNLPADGTYRVMKGAEEVARGTFRTGEAFTPDLGKVPSGEYRMITQVMLADEDGTSRHRALTTDTAGVVIFSEKDTRPPVERPGLWTYNRWKDGGKTLFVMIGSKEKDYPVFCDLIDSNGILSSEKILLSDSVRTFTLPYKEEYGDGVRLSVVGHHEGQSVREVFSLERPRPQKELKLEWSTFRSCLVPGQEEEWRMKVTYPDGKPAPASLTAALYDASLDAFWQKHDWHLSLYFPRYLPLFSQGWDAPSVPGLSADLSLRYRDVPEYRFTAWDDALFERHYGYSFRIASKDFAVRSEVALSKTQAARPMAMEANALQETVVTGYGKNAGPQNPVRFRSDFSETAFFYPALRTDEKGEATLRFRLPESTTTWNFLSLAHTKDMDYGALKESVVARKEIAVSPALPRFLRLGDETEIPVAISNFTDKEQRGEATLTLVDAATEKVLLSEKRKFSATAKGQGNVSFFVRTPKDAPLLVARISATGKNFSDGEERYLPVLTNSEQLVQTIPFTLRGEGRTTLRVDTLWQKDAQDRRLSIETTTNPIWYVVAALPKLALREEARSITDISEMLYAAVLGKHLAENYPELRAISADSIEETGAWANLLRRNPDLKNLLEQETPWSRLGDAESERTAALQRFFTPGYQERLMRDNLDKLLARQNSDGGWSWFPGMQSNVWMTDYVATLLARLQTLTGYGEAQNMIHRAYAFLHRKAEETLAWQEKRGTEYLSESLAHHYYLAALLAERGQAKKDGIIEKIAVRLRKSHASLNMYGKAKSAAAFALFGEKETAEKFLKSVDEHMVESPEMGRFFDSPYALFSSSQYPTAAQTATIEAALRLHPDAAAIDEMRLWLLQSKRTQMWATSTNSADAIYALLAQRGAHSVAETRQSLPLTVTAYDADHHVLAANSRSQARGASTADYTRLLLDAEKTASVEIGKHSPQLSWGSLYAVSSVPMNAAKAEGNGLTVTRTFERKQGTQWLPVRKGEKLERGAHVRARYDIRAERDFDFVSITATRAACLEPTQPLSGYQWASPNSFYRVVRDASNQYFFEQFRKGNHVFTEEFHTDRAGTFETGIARIQSVYAPEFGGHSGGEILSVE